MRAGCGRGARYLWAVWNATTSAGRAAGSAERREPAVGEHSRDEALTESRVRQPALLLDRQERQRAEERAGEEAAPHAAGIPVCAVDLHALHAAGRRGALEDVAARARALASARDPAARVVASSRRVRSMPVLVPTRRGRPRIALEADRLARRSEPDLDLGADGHPRHEAAERVRDERVALVAAVVAHLPAEEAGRDADLDLEIRGAPVDGSQARWPSGRPCRGGEARQQNQVGGDDDRHDEGE